MMFGIVALTIILLGAPLRADPTIEPSTEPATLPAVAPRGRYAQQLADESKELIALMIRRPYGWALPVDQKETGRAPQTAMGPLESPSAGLMLLWAGQFLDDPSLREAARQLGRGAAAAQLPTGMIANRAIFSVTPGRMQEHSYVAHRDTTIATMALWIMLLENPSDPHKEIGVGGDEQIRSAIMRATAWLEKQQAKNGGWPSGHPEDAETKDAIRILRLDNPDYRNSTLALLLVADTLHDKNAAKLARTAADLLVRIRVTWPNHSASLWGTAYSVDGSALDRVFGFPAGADALSSRYAMQTLMAMHIVLGDTQSDRAIEDAVKAVAAARKEDGTWPRFFDPGAPPKIATTQSARPGVTTRPVVDLTAAPADFGLSSVVAAATKLQTTTMERFQQDLGTYFSTHEHLAAAMGQLLDDPLVMQLSDSEQAAAEHLTQNAAEFDALANPPPDDLHVRVQRLWTLLKRAKIERRLGV